MTGARYKPTEVIPGKLAAVVERLPYWFVIRGQAVRCFAPYRPSDDVDFGVADATTMKELLLKLGRTGRTDILEQSVDTAHLRWNDIDVSVFVLPLFKGHVEDRHLNVEGILATKLHAILERGTRRDFFDLYIMLQDQRLGIAECLRAIREVYRQPVNESLLLRALSYFDDADGEPKLPGEGRNDWKLVKDFFSAGVAALLVPPMRRLQVQDKTVDVTPVSPARRRPAGARRRRK